MLDYKPRLDEKHNKFLKHKKRLSLWYKITFGGEPLVALVVYFAILYLLFHLQLV